jgi:hypothetical protein
VLVSDLQFLDPAGDAFAIGAVPSALTAVGTAFSVQWQPAVPVPTDP